MNFITLSDTDKLALLESALQQSEQQYYVALIYQGQHDDEVKGQVERVQGEVLRLRQVIETRSPEPGTVVDSGPVTLRPTQT